MEEENNKNSPSIYSPEFIPFYPHIKEKYNLSDKETLLYGFIRFYISSSPGRKFYFSNEQLGKILKLKEIAVSRLVNSLTQRAVEKVRAKTKIARTRRERIRKGKSFKRRVS